MSDYNLLKVRCDYQDSHIQPRFIQAMETPSYKEELEFATDLAMHAGSMIIEGFKQLSLSSEAKYDPKTSFTDLVTKVDGQVEEYIINEINKKYPADKIEAEETANIASEAEFIDGRLWSIDPIDGTTNFIHGFFEVSCSIGFLFNKEPVVGVVYNPFTQVVYFASKGSGAYCVTSNAEFSCEKLPLKYLNLPKTPLKLQASLISVGYGGDRLTDQDPPSRLDKFMTMSKRLMSLQGGNVHGLRQAGSTALEMCQVAMGSLDVLMTTGPWLHDVAAASCIINESGGIVASPHHPKLQPISGNDFIRRQYLAIRAADDAEQSQLYKDFLCLLD